MLNYLAQPGCKGRSLVLALPHLEVLVTLCKKPMVGRSLFEWDGGVDGEGGGWERRGSRRNGGRGNRLVCKINKENAI